MSNNFQYTSSDTYNLAADGSGGYYLNFVSSTGPDPYGTKYGTPYWDGGTSTVMQAIADGSGGTTYIAWDGYSPWPTYGTQLASTNTNVYGMKADALGNSYYLYTDETQYADGSGGYYYSWVLNTMSNPYYPYGWAFDSYHVDSSRYNYMGSYWYDTSYTQIYPYDYGYNGADGMGNTQWFSTSGSSVWYPSNGTMMSGWFTEYYSYTSSYIAADGMGGYYLQT
jgi:hypothetical protein